MQLRVTNLGMPVESPEEALGAAIAARLGIRSEELLHWRILRKSLDARARSGLKFVYSLLVEVPEERAAKKLSGLPGVEPFTPARFDESDPGSSPLEHRPIVIGSGPGGIDRKSTRLNSSH